MSYPTIPLALVCFLADISEERAKLEAGPTHVTVVAHSNDSIKSVRFAINPQNASNWGEMVEKAVLMATEDGIDTVSIIYPSSVGEPVDFGITLEANSEPFFFQWTFSPKFAIHLAPDHIIQQIRAGVGVETVQAVLNRTPRKLENQASASLVTFGNLKVAGSGVR